MVSKQKSAFKEKKLMVVSKGSYKSIKKRMLCCGAAALYSRS